MMDINYPSHRSGPQRLNHNIYDADQDERTFLINSYSDRPSPWKPNEFFKLVKDDIGIGKPKPINGGSKVAMTIKEWQRFWLKHGEKNDTKSILTKGMSVNYNESKNELVVNMPSGIAFPGSTNYEKIKSDYHNQVVPQNGTAVPGPFQSLKAGKNVFNIWKGLPLMPRGQLPSNKL